MSDDKNIHNQFRTTCEETFSLDYLNRTIADLHSPISIEGTDDLFGDDELWGHQKLHYMILKPNDSVWYIGELIKEIPEIENFIVTTMNIMRFSFLSGLMNERYAYLTIDTRDVKKGESQRAPGWHIDCVQGDEVPVKKSGNIAFTWCDALPTEYAYQTFNTEGCDISKHNVFEWLGNQVKEHRIKTIKTKTLTLMNTYCVHRSPIATEDTKRRYVRLSYTHVPITNKKLEINPTIEYDYPVHSTEGKIPDHLI